MNGYEIPNLRFGLPAGGTVYNRRFVTVNSDGNGVLAGAGGVAIGASMNQVASGQVLEVADGIVIVEAGATVAAGAEVQSDSTGRAITKAAGKGLGVAITGGDAGNFIAVKMLCVSAINGAAGADGEDGAAGDTLMTLLYTSSDLGAGADLTDVPLGAVPVGYDAEVISAQVISAGSASGVDAANTSVFALEVGTTAFAGETFDDVTAFPAAGAAQELVLVPAEVDLSAGDAILLTVTNGTTANLPIFVVQVVLKLTPAA